MSNEEMNKKMKFIVEHQAKFAAEIEIRREVQAAESKVRDAQDRKLSNALLGLVDIVGSLTRSQMNADDRVNSLEESFKRLAEAQARTEESLNILLNTVERHIHGNGGSANPS
ncbi:MAG TPA: hypothetical protein VGO73_11730 [Pyrinomonadaceae bacterium]|nr:hypothetical protein [Pyrinomonadaceae bacterium]